MVIYFKMKRGVLLLDLLQRILPLRVQIFIFGIATTLYFVPGGATPFLSRLMLERYFWRLMTTKALGLIMPSFFFFRTLRKSAFIDSKTYTLAKAKTRTNTSWLKFKGPRSKHKIVYCAEKKVRQFASAFSPRRGIIHGKPRFREKDTSSGKVLKRAMGTKLLSLMRDALLRLKIRAKFMFVVTLGSK